MWLHGWKKVIKLKQKYLLLEKLPKNQIPDLNFLPKVKIYMPCSEIVEKIYMLWLENSNSPVFH
jgi:hypothetical protein